MVGSLISNSNYTSQGGASQVVTMGYEDVVPMGYEFEDWFSLSWLKRVPLTINGGNVPSTQTDYSLLINRTISDLIGETEAELRFTNVNNIQLDYEIQEFDNSTGKLIAWIKKPSVSDGDVINIYYDNPTAIDEQNPQAVWSDYQYVAHLSDTPGGAGTILDSSPNPVNGTPNGVVSVSGKIGDALSFDGVDDYVDLGLIAFGNKLMMDNSDIAISCIIRPDLVGGNSEVLVDKGVEYSFFLNPVNQKLVLNLDVPSIVDSNTGIFPTVQFYHLVITKTNGVLTGQVYVNGVNQLGTVQAGVISNVESNMALGMDVTAQREYDGLLEQVTISKNIPTPDRIVTEFNNLMNNDTFYTIGAEENIPTFSNPMGYEA